MSELSVLARQVAEATCAMPAAVRRHVAVTPLISLRAASESCAAEILLKCEHQQKTGSFKVRGALAKLWSLSDEERRRGVIAAGLKTGRTRPGQTIVIVSCGANIASDALAGAIARPREDAAGPPGS